MEKQTTLTKEISIFEFAKLNNVEKTLYMFRFGAKILDKFTERISLPMCIPVQIFLLKSK